LSGSCVYGMAFSWRAVAEGVAESLGLRLVDSARPCQFYSDPVIYVGGLHTSSATDIYRLKAMCKLKRVVAYLTVEGPPVLTGVKPYLDRFRLADAFVAPSRYAGEQLELAGLEVSAVVPHRVRVYTAPRKHRLSSLGYIAGYQERKYPSYVMERVCDRLRKYDFRVVTTPNNPYRGCFAHVDLNAYRYPYNRIVEFYEKIGFYVSLSDSEGFGMTPLEAQATGAPVVAPRIPPLTETLESGVVWVEITGRRWYEPINLFTIEHHMYSPESLLEALEYVTGLSDKEYEKLSFEAYHNASRYSNPYTELAKLLEGV